MRLTDLDLFDLIWSEHLTPAEIAERYGYTPRAVQRRLTQSGIPHLDHPDSRRVWGLGNKRRTQHLVERWWDEAYVRYGCGAWLASREAVAAREEGAVYYE